VADPLAIYIHWPYCSRICPYCDFNVYKGAQNSELVEAILGDLSHWRGWSGAREIVSIHFGGGTPSLLAAKDIDRIIQKADELWGLPNGIEIGLEANPSDADEALWAAYRSAGINRLSLGVQTFHDAALDLLGRDHSGAKAKQAAQLAGRYFPNVSLDLIFGWTGQSLDDLEADLDLALRQDVQHISAYQLTIEPGTAFAKAEARGHLRRVDEDESANFMALVAARLRAEGFDQYEVSNFGRPGFYSQHNLSYWRGLDYVGAGPGAHGRLTFDGARRATVTHMKPDSYIAAVKSSGHGLEHNTVLEPEAWADEYVMMGLRCFEGISLGRYAQIMGQDLPVDEINKLVDEGLLKRSGDRLLATNNGRPFLDFITRKLLV